MTKRKQGRSPRFKYTNQEALARRTWRGYRYTCRRNGRKFCLTFEEFYSLIVQPCHYCGSPPSNKARYEKSYGQAVLYYSGLDRKDNGRDYHMDNLVPCCIKCNGIKSDHLTYEEMMVVASALMNFSARRSLLPGARDPQRLAQERLALLLSKIQKRAAHRPGSY